MKTYCPKNLDGSDLKQIMAEMVASPAMVAKFLQVTERSVWRWLAEGSAPRAVLCALWHETPHGREVSSLDVGNELVLTRQSARIKGDQAAASMAQLGRVLAISDTGAANDPLHSGPVSPVRPRLFGRVGVLPLGFNPVPQSWHIPHYGGGNQSAPQHNYRFTNQLVPVWKQRV